MTLRHTTSRGFIALVSAILFSAIFTSLVLMVSNHALQTRFNQLRHFNKILSSLRAYSCMYSALESFVEDATYSPRHAVFQISPSDPCIIDAVVAATSSVSMYVHGQSDTSSTFLHAIADIHPDGTLSFSSISESTSTPP